MPQNLAGSLYREVPEKVLYHYTSLSGLMGIVNSKSLWATEIKYLNDADELKYLGKIVSSLSRDINQPDYEVFQVYSQFTQWIKERLDNGHMLFVCSFTENGNLLSQWRGYCPPGEGVSLGFEPATLTAAAAQQDFLIGRCIYDVPKQNEIVASLLDAVLAKCLDEGPAPETKRHFTQSYYSVFENLELDILRIAALLKNPAFQEEVEWRIISPIHANYAQAPIKYRKGKRMLVPYVELQLGGEDGRVRINDIYVGPTVDLGLSFNSIRRFVSKYAICKQVSNSQLPYTGTH